MKAIVSIIQTSQGPRVSLLGLGHSEAEARRAAFSYVIGSGHNDFDEEYEGGTLMPLAPRLAELVRRGDDAWLDTYDESGRLVASEASEASFELDRALGRLVVDQGRLDYRA